VRSTEYDAEYDEQDAGVPHQRGRRRVRPEADSPSVSATAHRLDREGGGTRALLSGASPGGAGQSLQSLPGPGDIEGRRPGGTGQALPEGRVSRTVDTVPVSDARWDTADNEPILVPSRRDDSVVPESVEPMSPRRAEMEVVQGRPVYVVYRPSRGLEVADD
jgi:hypothetical protein